MDDQKQVNCPSAWYQQDEDGEFDTSITTIEIIDLADGDVRTGPRLPMRALDGCAAHYNGFIYWVAGLSYQVGVT